MITRLTAYIIAALISLFIVASLAGWFVFLLWAV